MKVWCAFHGEYSDYHLVAVCSTKEKADAVAALGRRGHEVIECEIDENVDLLVAGYDSWRVRFTATGNVVGEPNTAGYGDPEIPTARTVERVDCIFWGGTDYGHGIVVGGILARSAEEALKIAADARAEFLASNG